MTLSCCCRKEQSERRKCYPKGRDHTNNQMDANTTLMNTPRLAPTAELTASTDRFIFVNMKT